MNSPVSSAVLSDETKRMILDDFLSFLDAAVILKENNADGHDIHCRHDFSISLAN